MARRAKPWYRKGRGWFVQIDGRQQNLGPDKRTAFEQFHKLMSTPSAKAKVFGESLAFIFDEFLEWTKKHREPRTYQW